MSANNPEPVDKADRVGKTPGWKRSSAGNGDQTRAESVIVRGALMSVHGTKPKSRHVRFSAAVG
jgi:hypothetical protein